MSARRPPGKILLATDLSHRTDRALDRSVQLARQWGASLLVVHAIEPEVDEFYDTRIPYDLPSWRRRVDPAVEVRDRLQRDLAEQGDQLDIQIQVEAGAPVDVVKKVAAQNGVDLIVTGVARAETLGRLWLGSTVDRLARKPEVPLLIVRDRPFTPYADVVVATDFAPSSRAALETAAAWFPEAQFQLFHGYDLPFASFLGRAEIDRQLEEFENEAVKGFLAEADLGEIDSGSIRHLVEHGSPASLLRDYAKLSSRHLVVVGSHGGGVVYETLIGSTARTIIDAVPGDVLLVPDVGRRSGETAAD